MPYKKRNLESIWANSYTRTFFSNFQNKGVWCAEHSNYQTYSSDEMLQELTKMSEVDYSNMMSAKLKHYTAYCEVCSTVSKKCISTLHNGQVKTHGVVHVLKVQGCEQCMSLSSG